MNWPNCLINSWSMSLLTAVN